jgi:hypothetical protein
MGGDQQLYVTNSGYTFETAETAIRNIKKIHTQGGGSITISVLYLKEPGHADPNHRHPYLSGITPNRPWRIIVRRINTEPDRESEFGSAWYYPVDPDSGKIFDQPEGWSFESGAVQLKDNTIFAAGWDRGGIFSIDRFNVGKYWTYIGGRTAEVNRMSVISIEPEKVSVDNTVWATVSPTGAATGKDTDANGNPAGTVVVSGCAK